MTRALNLSCGQCFLLSRRRTALGVRGGSRRKPATPATRTDVSTTPLGGRFHGFGDNGRLSLSSAAPNIRDGSDDILAGHAFDALRTFE